jgi:non-ribosomal peptide synthetase component F
VLRSKPICGEYFAHLKNLFLPMSDKYISQAVFSLESQRTASALALLLYLLTQHHAKAPCSVALLFHHHGYRLQNVALILGVGLETMVSMYRVKFSM